MSTPQPPSKSADSDQYAEKASLYSPRHSARAATKPRFHARASAARSSRLRLASKLRCSGTTSSALTHARSTSSSSSGQKVTGRKKTKTHAETTRQSRFEPSSLKTLKLRRTSLNVPLSCAARALAFSRSSFTSSPRACSARRKRQPSCERSSIFLTDPESRSTLYVNLPLRLRLRIHSENSFERYCLRTHQKCRNSRSAQLRMRTHPIAANGAAQRSMNSSQDSGSITSTEITATHPAASSAICR